MSREDAHDRVYITALKKRGYRRKHLSWNDLRDLTLDRRRLQRPLYMHVFNYEALSK